MPSLSLKVKAVCGPVCNYGWMSELEGRARPLLTEMILGNKTALDERDQSLVAQWFVKTAMMFVYATPRRGAIPANQYRYLFDHRRPPPSTQVWLGVRTAAEGVAAGVLQTLSLRQTPEGGVDDGRAYLVIVGIGHLAGAVFGHNLRFEIPWARAALEEIWPVSGPIEWPPGFVFQSIEGLSDDPAFQEHMTDSLDANGITVIPASFLS